MLYYIHKYLSIILLLSITSYATVTIKSIQNILPDELKDEMSILKIGKKDILGLYPVYLKDGNVIYFHKQKQLIFYGRIFSIKNKNIKDLTGEKITKWSDELATKMATEANIKYIKKIAVLDKLQGGNEQQEWVIFDSPICPYCKKVNDFLTLGKYKLNVWRVYNNIPQSIQILQHKFKIKNSSQRAEKMEELYRKYNVIGTPYIMVLQNNTVVKVIKGADIAEIKKWLQ